MKKIIFLPKSIKLLNNSRALIIKSGKFNILVEIPTKISFTKLNALLIFNFDKSLTTWFVLLQNILYGSYREYALRLVLKGVGYKANLLNDSKVDFKLGFSHPIVFNIIDSLISVKLPKNTIISLRSPLKDVLSSAGSSIRGLKEPDSYKGKGIMYKGELLRNKVGKKA